MGKTVRKGADDYYYTEGESRKHKKYSGGRTWYTGKKEKMKGELDKEDMELLAEVSPIKFG